ncbi:MAG: NCS2 family permease [Pseudomonadota bacterium]|jgi:AGZA family xanthine/uracil permease-like MFS transporter|nr:MAG: guanine permease [Pseudomonadota bacterium]
MLERYFELERHKTTVRTEILAGVTTFMTMAYIIFVNPQILADAGMDRGAVFVATCLAAALASALMGLYANYPIALAPGMGLNAYFTYSVVLGMGHSWQTALGAVFLSGILFLIVSLTRIREWVIDSIPLSLKLAIAAGIGLFLAIIGLKSAGIIQGSEATLVTLGDLKSLPVVLAVLGFLVMVALDARGIPGAIIIGILAVTAVGIALGVNSFGGIVSMPPSIAPVFLQLDILGALEVGLIAIVFTFFFVDVFDNTGTLVGVAHKAGLVGPDGKLPRVRRALTVDSTAAMAGALLGTSTTTSYIESAAGVNAGGRTGLVAVTVAVLFLAALFFAPLAGSIPAFATAPALVYVACIMMSAVKEIDFSDVTEYTPAIITIAAMPLTFSIAHGIAFGFITYTGIKLLAGRLSDIKPAVAVLAVLFVLKFAYL